MEEQYMVDPHDPQAACCTRQSGGCLPDVCTVGQTSNTDTLGPALHLHLMSICNVTELSAEAQF